MADQKPAPDYEERRRPRVLEKLNSKATRWSVARKAIISAAAAAAIWWLLRLNNYWHPEWWAFVCWEVAAVIAAAATEWQPID